MVPQQDIGDYLGPCSRVPRYPGNTLFSLPILESAS